MCCFSAKHAALRRTSKDWLAWNQNNVSAWNDITTRGLFFQWASTIEIQLQLSLLVKNKADLIIISLKINLFSPWYSWKIAELALNNCHSLTHSTICQLYRGSQFCWWRKPKYPEKTTDLPQVTDNQTLAHNVVSSTPRHERNSNSQL